jgi:hypothetical protein
MKASSILFLVMLLSISSSSSSFSFQLLKRSSSIYRMASSPSLASSSILWASTRIAAPLEAAPPEKMIKLHTIPQNELEEILKSWGHPKYRAKQIITWVRQGVTDISEMKNLPKALRADLEKFASIGSLSLDCELISKDGTKKRAYRLADGQLIESVLMPYRDGRYTACISSQAG